MALVILVRGVNKPNKTVGSSIQGVLLPKFEVLEVNVLDPVYQVFIDCSNQIDLYHTSLQSKIWDLKDENLLLNNSSTGRRGSIISGAL